MLDPHNIILAQSRAAGGGRFSYGYRYDREQIVGQLPPSFLARSQLESLGQPDRRNLSIPLKSADAPLRLTSTPLVARPALPRPESLASQDTALPPPGIRVLLRVEGIDIPKSAATIVTALQFSGGRRTVVEVDYLLPVPAGNGAFGTTTDITDALHEAGSGIAGFAVEMTAHGAQGEA